MSQKNQRRKNEPEKNLWFFFNSGSKMDQPMDQGMDYYSSATRACIIQQITHLGIALDLNGLETSLRQQ